MHIKKVVSTFLRQYFSKEVGEVTLSTVGGGCINEVYKLECNLGSFLIKINDAGLYPDMFRKEAQALKKLSVSSKFRIPKVFGIIEEHGRLYLVMEFIEEGQPSSNFWKLFANKLAHLHRQSNEKFGWKEDNYIGSLHQSNNVHDDWVSFFINERIEPQLMLAINEGRIDASNHRKLSQIESIARNIFPVEAPALIHGDLWSGNFMVDEEGLPVLIDPAIYYGHREMELAFTKMFGGFNSEMYNIYNEVYPLENGFSNRIPLYNLYPLLVHVNLFNGGYTNQLKTELNKF